MTNAEVLPSSPAAKSNILVKNTDDAIARVHELRRINESHTNVRPVIRAILNGGAEAVKVLVADSQMDHVPGANLIHSAIERVAQKLIDVPGVRVTAPQGNDSSRSRTRAEKRERIVEGYDHASNMRLQIPQVARWLPGYGFCAWTISSSLTDDKQPYPAASLRDPYGTLPGPWTVHQQPSDVAFVRRMPESALRAMYPSLTSADMRAKGRYVSVGGALMLDNSDGRGWEGASDGSLRVIEYRNADGTYLILEDSQLVLDFEPTPEGVGTPFVIAKRFSFDKLMGQFDHVIGLQQMMTRMNVLAFLAVQDEVFAPTNITGNIMSGTYKQGRSSVNIFEPGSRVDRPTTNSTFQSFGLINELNGQLRTTGAYPAADDGKSPTSFATGKGVQELGAGSDNVVREYQLVIQHALETLDRKRLAWDEGSWPDKKRALPGHHKGTPFTETYTPSKDIAHDFATRRQYGMLAGLDSSGRLVGLLQLMQADLIDNVSAMENISGIDDVQQVLDRLSRQKSAEMLEQAMMASISGQEMDPRVLRILIDTMEPGPRRDKYEEVFFPEPQEDGAPTDPLTGGPAQAQPLEPSGDDVLTIMSRVMASGQTSAGAQTVQTT
jgi:hypothetical protein